MQGIGRSHRRDFLTRGNWLKLWVDRFFAFMQDFENLLESLDISLFEKIPSQSTDEDKQTLLACQLAARELAGTYKYLEIGSYLGGSIQPHLLDPRCSRIYSIDKRPETQPDARGMDFTYLNNSTERMMEGLRGIEGGNVGKIATIDGETSGIDPERVGEKVHLCFIDGEHTDTAVMSDFKFCLRALRGVGAVMFHDAQIVYNGIQDCLDLLERDGVRYNAYALPNAVFAIEVGDFPVHRHPKVQELLLRNHRAYLYSLQENDRYRRFANRFPFRLLKTVYLKAVGGNTCR